MSDSRYISVEGVEEVNAMLEHLSDKVQQEAMAGLKKAGLKIIADAQRNLRANRTNVTGQLSNSGRVQEVNGAYECGFFGKDSGPSYAEYVEYGRRSGKFPPLHNIIQWVRKKFGMREDEARRMAFPIALGISRKGTRPHPFFVPAVENNKGEVEKAVQNAVNNVTGKNYV